MTQYHDLYAKMGSCLSRFFPKRFSRQNFSGVV